MKLVKIFILVVLAGMMMMSAVACSGSKKESKPSISAKESEVQEDKGGDDAISKLSIVTENYVPYNYEENGVIKGSSTENVKAAIKKLGTDVPITLYPWARALEMAETDKNVLIYSIAKTKERETKFKWISQVGEVKVYFYALNERSDIKLNSIEDAKKYKIGVTAKDFTEDGLKKQGFNDQLLSSPNQSQTIRQLFDKKVDLWVASVEESDMGKLCEKEGHDPKNIKKAMEVKELGATLWIAANKDMSEDVVSKLKSAFQK